MLGPSLALNLPTGLYWECGCGKPDLDSFHHPGSIAYCPPPQIPAVGPERGRGMFVPTQCHRTQIGFPRFVTEKVLHSLFIPQLCPTLCDPVDCNLLGSSVPEISQPRILEWVAVSFSRRSSWPRDRTWVSCIGRQILYHQATREVCYCTQRAEIPNCSSNTHTHQSPLSPRGLAAGIPSFASMTWEISRAKQPVLDLDSSVTSLVVSFHRKLTAQLPWLEQGWGSVSVYLFFLCISPLPS